MKIVSDSFKDADKVLADLLTFEDVAKGIADNIAPFAIGGKGRALPRYVVETSQALRPLLVKDFSMYFPAISAIVINGEGDDQSYSRIHDACFIFHEVQTIISENHCVIRDETLRKDLYDRMCKVVGDIVVFICIQFKLYRLEDEEMMLSISRYCESTNVSADVFYGLQLQTLGDYKQSWYSYEVLSPYYSAMVDFDPIFLAECEENFYPLTDDLSAKILDGTLDIPSLRGKFLEMSANTEISETRETPMSLIEKMKLE